MEAINKLKGLAIGLLVLGIIFVLFYFGMGYLQKISCEQGGTIASGSTTSYYWTGTQCQISSTNTTAVTLDAVTAATNIKSVGTIILGLLTFVFVVLIFVIVMKAAKELTS